MSYNSGNDEVVDLKFRPGKNGGLTVILDAHSNYLAAGSLEGDFKGFMATVRPAGTFPMTSLGAVHIQPGEILNICLIFW